MFKIHERFGSATVICKNGGEKYVLFSYETPVAVNDSKGFKVTEKKFSRTTSKHINQWLNGASHETVPQEEIERIAEC